MENKKIAFITSGSELSIKEMAFQLIRNGIDLKIGSGHNHHSIFVASKDYNRALVIGDRIIKMFMIDDINWIDSDRKVHKAGFVPIIKEVVPISRLDEVEWQDIDSPEHPSCPRDIKDFFDEMRKYCGIKSIKLEYDKEAMAFNVYFESRFEDYEVMLNRCKGFHRVYDCPFIESWHLNIDGSLNGGLEDTNGQEVENIESYFYNSMLYKVITNPIGSIISPTNNDDIFKNILYTKAALFNDYGKVEVSRSYRKSAREFVVEGFFSIDFSFRRTVKDKSIDKFLSIKSSTQDRGNFSSVITINPTGVDISTSVTARRQILGTDFGLQDFRSGFFKGLLHDGDEEEFLFNEHYSIINNGSKLLHYSDEYDSSETFLLPFKWRVENGIFVDNCGHSYDPNNDVYYCGDNTKDEIAKVLEARKLQKGSAFIISPKEEKKL